jgi:hypothetical protein
MPAFFMPQTTLGDAAAEDGYQALREHARRSTGLAPRDRRIVEIECRRQGRDQRLRVGELDDLDGRVVEAIIELGRRVYTVHHVEAGPGAPLEPTVLSRTEVYSVTDFD